MQYVPLVSKPSANPTARPKAFVIFWCWINSTPCQVAKATQAVRTASILTSVFARINAKAEANDQSSQLARLFVVQRSSQAVDGVDTKNRKKKRRKTVSKTCNPKNFIAKSAKPEKQMRFIQIILPCINEIHIVAVQIHVHGNIGMMRRIIVHQRHEQAGDINQSEHRKKKNINAFGKNAGIQTMEFAGKVKLFLLQ